MLTDTGIVRRCQLIRNCEPEDFIDAMDAALADQGSLKTLVKSVEFDLLTLARECRGMSFVRIEPTAKALLTRVA